MGRSLTITGAGAVLIIALLITYFIINRPRQQNKETPMNALTENDSNLTITSTVFANNSRMPVKYTCDGDDISPPLNIGGVPTNAKSLVLIMDDPDAPAGTWDHWIVFNIPPQTEVIGEGEEPMGVKGENSWDRTGYGGPCPPSGTHRYFFKVYALDTQLNLSSGVRKNEIERAIEGHVLAFGELVGFYSRSR